MGFYAAVRCEALSATTQHRRQGHRGVSRCGLAGSRLDSNDFLL